jgi:hypothetical protein
MPKTSAYTRVFWLLVLALAGCAHTRQTVVLAKGQPVDLRKFDMRKQSLVIPLEAGETFPLEVTIDGDYVATRPAAAVELTVKKSCWVRIDDRGMRISPDGRDFDAKPKRPGSFRIGLGVTAEGKRASLHVVTPTRVP